MKIEIHSFIDHTFLKPDAIKADIVRLCKEAKTYQFASVCVNPIWVSLCSEMLKGTSVKVAAVVGFPLGATTPEAKAFETKQAVQHGANEIDMVMNIGALKSGDTEWVYKDILAVVQAAGENVKVKVILETGLLSLDQVEDACLIAVRAGAHFVKTSTGFGAGGATIEHVQLMRKMVGTDRGVKASGGIRDFKTAVEMIEAGANRIGTSSGVTIVKGEEVKGDY
ncbi:deoxyribose-phosphate aldolase [Ammoniphilus resinae]|uniref:Deoxyribose-phosphate aldolase n=1 Tax=Ammoniphilus resinae TaxID=861532 RepID=A0ABS4GJU0_9BACL|nr:deoxyribose-phosphate aldolase [Ammoniphilus resinae]MBP1930516.1 deoxyribose-phosphate aldolase [Ammoniphilus resinae]